jgi:PleD family two-component response regulator
MHLRVLLVESDPEDLLFFEDVLLEVEELHLHRWLQIETLAASTWMEAATILSRETLDIILLNPNLRDSYGVTTYRRIQQLAPDVPVIVLTGAEDRDLASHLVREGAQDFLTKKQLDCAPLAHAIQNAIERQRRLAAARATAMSEPLTGLLNREAFVTLAGRDRMLAESLQRRWLLILAELRSVSDGNPPFGEQRRDLALVEAGDFLRGVAGGTGLLARVSELRFALALFETPAERLETVRERIDAAAAGRRLTMGAAIFEPDHPVPFETLMQLAEADLAPSALAMGR